MHLFGRLHTASLMHLRWAQLQRRIIYATLKKEFKIAGGKMIVSRIQPLYSGESQSGEGFLSETYAIESLSLQRSERGEVEWATLSYSDFLLDLGDSASRRSCFTFRAVSTDETKFLHQFKVILHLCVFELSSVWKFRGACSFIDNGLAELFHRVLPHINPRLIQDLCGEGIVQIEVLLRLFLPATHSHSSV